MPAAVGIRATQTHVFASVSEPSQDTRATQAAVLVAEDSNGGEIQTTQTHILAAVRGRTTDPAVRAWTFTLDGHDFYVLRLGNSDTLVYDLTTEQWYIWGDQDSTVWGLYSGTNWVEGNKFANEYGSNVLVGSDASGALYFLDPDKEKDDGNLEGRDATTFTRVVIGQVPVRGYNRVSIYEIDLIGSIGKLNDATLTDVTLHYSDDQGANYTSAGTITLPDGELTARASWRSLGSFEQPGRLIKITDTGALKRIDSLTMNSDLDDGA